MSKGMIYPEILDRREYKVGYGESPSIDRVHATAVTIDDTLCECTEIDWVKRLTNVAKINHARGSDRSVPYHLRSMIDCFNVAKYQSDNQYDKFQEGEWINITKKENHARNLRKYGTKHNQFMQAVRRRGEHRSERGVKQIKGQKPAPKGAYGEDWKPEITHSKLGDATKKAAEKKKKEAQKGLPPHLQGDWLGKARKAFKENYRVLARDKDDKGRPAQFSYKDEKDANKFADSIKSKGGKATVAKEEAYDTYKDKHLEKYGSRPGEYDRPRPSTGGGKHSGNDKMTKRKNSDKAVDNVVADLKKKYGENAVLHSKRSYVAGKRVK